MSAISEREAVLRERKAFDAGAVWGHDYGCVREKVDAVAVQRYPLPLRVLPDPHEAGIYWRVEVRYYGTVCDKIMLVKNMGDFEPLSKDPLRFGLTVSRAKLWADLFENPYEPEAA